MANNSFITLPLDVLLATRLDFGAHKYLLALRIDTRPAFRGTYEGRGLIAMDKDVEITGPNPVTLTLEYMLSRHATTDDKESFRAFHNSICGPQEFGGWNMVIAPQSVDEVPLRGGGHYPRKATYLAMATPSSVLTLGSKLASEPEAGGLTLSQLERRLAYAD